MDETKKVREDIPVEPTGLSKAGTDLAKQESAIEQLERRNEMLQRSIKLCIGQTNRSDWVSLGGKPYLQASGAHKIARLYGIGIRDVNYIKTNESDEKGAYYRYEYKAVFWAGNEAPQEIIGSCTSRDKFFGQLSEKKDKQTGDIIQEARFKESWEINENDIQKKAYTNCINNGIKQYTGMKDVSWEEVAMYAKGSAEIGKVTYQSGKQAAEGDKKSDDDKFVQMDKWIDSMAFFEIRAVEGGDGEMEVKEITNEANKNSRKEAIYQSLTKWKNFPTQKNIEEVKNKVSGKNDMTYAVYKKFETKYAEFKKNAEQLGVEGL